MVGLEYDKYKDKSPFEISGGQKRRVAIAGVVAMEPKVLILDEPTAGLDPKGRDEILGKIKDLHKEYNMTIILVSHSMEDVAKLADRILVMDSGKCILDGTPQEVFSEADTLESVGLAVPQVTYLAKKLNKKGFNMSTSVFTVQQAKDEILRILNKG
jgi:ABC-type cobalt transport system, ATPase component